MPRVSSRAALLRSRWSAFLDPLVGRNRPVSVLELDRKRADLAGQTGDARMEIYAYLNGKQSAGRDRAFYCGEALRELGITWCSGPLALYAAGHLGDYVRAIGNLALLDGDGTRAATMGILAPIAADVSLGIRADLMMTATGASNWVEAARARLARDFGATEHERFVRAFSRMGRGIDPLVRRIEPLATLEPREDEDLEFIERSVWAAMCEWGLSRCEPATRVALASALAEISNARFARIMRQANTSDYMVQQILQRGAAAPREFRASDDPVLAPFTIRRKS